jgi:hypothetical protein
MTATFLDDSLVSVVEHSVLCVVIVAVAVFVATVAESAAFLAIYAFLSQLIHSPVAELDYLFAGLRDSGRCSSPEVQSMPRSENGIVGDCPTHVVMIPY